ncbi:thiamine-phosphate kinase [Aphanothece sacrum]|uniref:Thiamine-monophosphate kinase n=1 Tax=Aphanothece sacrum FPU1 TaxID=1920663 RepID=A0A401IIR3_APHSA|nr:thiamine-phosphate kinase [Aphanothece sacrum]GBF81096.1 thiamine-monophosphate kinase [Aphanothece sacrum FPU1]GBF85497.1 thiamine-monophosphate kinase [Aphanothece sacrum FPU3]
MKIKDIGEQGLLKKLQSFCPSDIIGDDGAVLSINPQQQLVITTDVLVDNVHFSDRTTPPDTVGWRAATANLSDLAAMGATPIGITVGLCLPGDMSVHWVEQLYQGLAECLQRYNTPIVGGDICSSSVTTISITAFGQVEPSRVIRRCAAQPGQVILITGYHGMSRAGLELLLNPKLGHNLTPSEQECLILAHQRPNPRLDVLPYLWDKMGTTQIGGMDSSDGLADAVIQLCRMSGVGAKIERSRLPISPILSQWVSPEQALDWVLYGGEDFELVLCLPENLALELLKNLEEGAAIIGKIIEEPQVILIKENGQRDLNLFQGFQHFS